MMYETEKLCSDKLTEAGNTPLTELLIWFIDSLIVCLKNQQNLCGFSFSFAETCRCKVHLTPLGLTRLFAADTLEHLKLLMI